MSEAALRERERHRRELRAAVLAGERLIGVFLNMGSAVSAELCAQAGYDWGLIDLEHGLGSEGPLLHELQALELGGAAALVRVEAGTPLRLSRALDKGAAGVVVPRVRSAAEARQVIDWVRYPPDGSRGVATSARAAGYGALAHHRVREVNETITTVIQIENEQALAEVEAIAAVDGVDALFVGPNDLTHALAIPGRFDDARYIESLEKVAAAAAAAGKAAGILLRGPAELEWHAHLGYTLLAMGSDSGLLAKAAQGAVASLREAGANEAAAAGHAPNTASQALDAGGETADAGGPRPTPATKPQIL